MNEGQLKSLFDRINRLLDDKAALTADIGDVFQEVKSAGYIPKVLRTVIRRARADQSKLAEEDAIQELYEGALTGRQRKAVEMAASGATAREIEQATGMKRSVVSRSVPLEKSRGTKPAQHDPETGEIPNTMGNGSHDDVIETPAAPPTPAGAAERLPSILADEAGSSAAIHASEGDNRTFAEIVGEMPERLRRARVTA